MPTAIQLRSKVASNNTLELSLVEVDIPEPGPKEVLVRVDATPINPSDLGLLLGPADVTTAKASSRDGRPVVTFDIDEAFMPKLANRVDQSMPVGNEGAGVVIAAGESDAAQALNGKLVGMVGGEMYAQYRCIHVAQAIEMAEGTTAAEAASCFVNPMTVQAMVETMRNENHSAMVHTAAASNLGQMLNRLCKAEGIELVNIVRKPEQEALLRDMGAAHVVNSSSENFFEELTDALEKTGATLAFDAIGGGKLGARILSCMEAAATRGAAFSIYGSDAHKQLYIYGGLDPSPTQVNRSFGFSWGIGGWLLTPVMKKLGKEKTGKMRQRVSKEIGTTFASEYKQTISLEEALSPDIVTAYRKTATGEKFLIQPQT